MLLSGHQKRAMKTFFCDALSLGITAGAHVDSLAPGRAKVLYIQEEGSPQQVLTRMRAVARGLGLAGFPADLHILHRAYSRLYRGDWIEWISRYCAKRGIDVIIIDNLTYVHDLDENAKRDMSEVMNGIRMIQTEAGATVILVAHLNDAHGEDPKCDLDRQVRGSSVIVQAYDTHIALRRYSMKSPAIVGRVRQRLGEEIDFSIVWKMKSDAQGLVHWARPTITFGASDGRIAALETGAKYSRTRLAELWQVPRTEVDLLIKSYVDDGILRPTGARFVLHA